MMRVCWRIISESQILYGSLVWRHGRSRLFSSYQEIIFFEKIVLFTVLACKGCECLKNTTIHPMFCCVSHELIIHVGDYQQIHFAFEQTAFKFALPNFLEQ